jgi:hypothetical protein
MPVSINLTDIISMSKIERRANIIFDKQFFPIISEKFNFANLLSYLNSI